MGANGADGADGPDGADGANRRRPAPTDADRHRRRITTRKHPHTPTVGEAQSSAMSGGLVGCCLLWEARICANSTRGESSQQEQEQEQQKQLARA